MNDGKVLAEVPAEERQSWVAVMFVWIGSMICLSSILTGATLVSGLNFIVAAVAGVSGYAIILLITVLQGIESTDLGKPTVVVSEHTYGEIGTRYIFSLIIAISLIGWFGIQAEIAGQTVSVLMADLFGITIGVPIASLVIGILMLITAVYGFQMMKYFNYVSVPLMILVLGLATFNAVTQNDLSLLLSYQPASSLTFIQGLGIVVGGFIVGAVIAGDYTRFNKTRKDTIKSAAYGIVPAGILLILIGAILAIFSGEQDLTLVLVSYVNNALLVYVMLLLATWTTNVTNAYSAGLAIVTGLKLEDKHRTTATVVSGLIGTLLAVVGILNSFEGFLIILTALVTPISGVMIADYWICYKGDKERFVKKQANDKLAIIAWACGCIPALVVTPPFSNWLPQAIVDNSLIAGLSSFIGIFIAMAIYLVGQKTSKVVEGECDAAYTGN